MKEFIGKNNLHSFVTVAVGKEKELQRLLDYIQQLTVPKNYNYEWIIVTENSHTQSNTAANTTFVECKSNNISKLRNYGAEFAKGEYISFIDVDMIFSSDFLEKIILELQNHSKTSEKIVLLHYIYAFNIDYNEEVLEIFKKISPTNIKTLLSKYESFWSDYRKDIFKLNNNNLSLLKAPWVYGWSGAFTCKNAEFKKIKGFDESFVGWGAEDTDLSYRLFQNSNVFFAIETAFVIHYPHPKKTNSQSSEYFLNRNRLFEKQPSLESELYKFITGINLNNILNVLDSISLSSLSPIYEHHTLNKIRTKMKKNNLFIGIDSIGTLQTLLPQELLVWSNKTEQAVNAQIPEIKTQKAFGVSTQYQNNYFDCVFIFEHGISLIPSLKEELIYEANRISDEVILIRASHFVPIIKFKDSNNFNNSEISIIEL